MALFHTTVVDNQIKALDTIGTSSGSIATFDTDRAERLVNLEVAITATQSGSGTPSPSNPRPINGFSACNLSVNGTTETIPFGQTVYGGSLNVGSGVLTVTHISKTFDGSETWYQDDIKFYTTWSKDMTPAATGIDGLCSNYQVVRKNFTNVANGECGIGLSGITVIFSSVCFGNSSITSVADFKTWLSNNLVKIVYPLATPTIIQLDSKQIQTIANSVNNIYADTGDIIDLKFVLTVGKAIS